MWPKRKIEFEIPTISGKPSLAVPRSGMKVVLLVEDYQGTILVQYRRDNCDPMPGSPEASPGDIASTVETMRTWAAKHHVELRGE